MQFSIEMWQKLSIFKQIVMGDENCLLYHNVEWKRLCLNSHTKG